MSTKKYIRMPVLQQIVPLAKSTIYQKMAEGTFPKPTRIGARAVAWDMDLINEYIDEQTKQVA